jgi:cytochrome c oxidase cbb3-type subunit 3
MNTALKAAGNGAQTSFWSNGPVMLMLLSIIILLIVIIIIGKIVSAIVMNDTNETWKKLKENKKIGMVILLLLSTLSGNAQDAAMTSTEVPAASTGLMFGMDSTLFWVMLFVLVFEFLVLMVLSYILYIYLLKKGLVQPIASKLPKWLQFNAMLGNDVPLEKDAEMLTVHDYDGIQELDNGMPPMLKYIFIMTVIAAFAYWINYHVLEASPLMIEEYENELVQAAIDKEAYLKKAGNAIDEKTVVLSNDATVLAAGEKIYIQNCVACHGDKGQGGVGPNFTDNYWIHGGDIKNLFTTIKYGVPAKGMRSWQSEIKPGDIQAVSSFILTKLVGTNVAGGKEPQGVLYDPAANAATISNDSTAVVNTTDSTKK